MNQITVKEARERTAELIAACPEWCTLTHDPQEHPEDVSHRRELDCGVEVVQYAIDFDDRPSTSIYVPEDEANEGDLTRDEAATLAGALTSAVALFDEVTA